MTELTNCQMIMALDVKADIEKLKTEGKTFHEILKSITAKYDSYWCVTKQEEREAVLNASLYAYAMTPEQQKGWRELNRLIAGNTVGI